MLRTARLEIASIAAIVGGMSLGCATPGPVVRLDPQLTSDVTWVAGRAVLAKEQSGVRVAAAFEHQDGQRLVLRIEIHNDTDQPFVVGPRDLTFMPCNVGQNIACPYSYPIVDPEAELLALELAGAHQRAAAANEQAVYVPLLLLSVFGDVGSLATGEHRGTAGLHTASLVSRMEASAARQQRAMLSIDTQRELWSNVAFRTNTVPPGAVVGGLVYLPIHLSAQYLWVHVRAGGQIFPFRFQQRVHVHHQGRGGGPRPGAGRGLDRTDARNQPNGAAGGGPSIRRRRW